MLWLLACTPQPSSYAATEVVALRVDPADSTVTVTPGAPVEVDFVATATFADDSERAIDLVSWTSSNASVGAIDLDGHFTSVDDHGGTTTITADHLGTEATATLAIVYQERVVEVDEAVADALDAATASGTTALSYPPDGVTVPRNIEGFAFGWPEGTVARIHFESEITDITVYAEGNSWTATSDLWQRIAASNRAGTVSVTVRTGDWNGTLTNVKESAPINVSVNRLDARGSVLYWETNASAIMRIPFGTTTATQFYPAETDNTCIGCHVLSESSQLMAVTHDGVNGVFDLVDVANPDTPTKLLTSADGNRLTFTSLSPDGKWLVGSSNGALQLYSVPAGGFIRTLSTEGYQATQPGWSPDGTRLVYVRATGSWFSDMTFTGGEIVTAPFDGTDLGAATVMVERGTMNAYYPAYSPDGGWIVYNRSTGDAYADDDSELWLMSADGTVDLRLDTANGATTRNSFPRWAPLPDDDVLWLAWSSKRGYPLGGSQSAGQIWVSAVDTTKAAAGEDPSAPAFWLPGQKLEADNHLPVWWSQ